ncbi:c-type cytochrome biogenesis protein CcsB [Planctomonas sp. JC2975]|uniref:c-type cytochrome biogenesis protein CcsB n=1 Tax=Planctomonas sp. JC2975 TaxID=2729626 RepID=UPI00147399E5|nr:c-type cytochrome biogenesis protein CcsB [Planctomonas sp. JC2975]
MGLYAVAFVFFALDLARRSARATIPASVPSAVSRRSAATEDVLFVEAGDAGAAGAASGRTGAADAATTATATVTATRAAASGGSGGRSGSAAIARLTSRIEDDVHGDRVTSTSLRVAMVVTIVGFSTHLLADLFRGLAAGRVPWANMWEFSMTGTLIIVGIFLLANLRFDVRYLGTFVLFLVCILLMIATTKYYVPVVPLPPALQSYWLVIHIMVALLATAFFALGFALSAAQLLQVRREHQVAQDKPTQLRFLATLPKSDTLENLAYRINIVGFIFWTFTLIAGAIWAEKAWGRYWGWDTKEVWTFIIWVIYAGYIHARATRGWRGTRSAWLALIGFSAVMFNFGVVNVFFHGLHSYSGLTS